jgi:sugar (pentulose or hexulose) kinase
MALFFGIDVGTSFIKVALLDPDECAVRHVHRVPMPDFVSGLPAGRCEVDPVQVMRAVGEALESLISVAPGPDGVVLCGQMQGFVLVNARGEPLSNYISWLDQRVSALEFGEFAERVTVEERADLANELRPDIALPLLWWLKSRNSLPSEAATPVSLADFVAGRLCRTVPAMEPTQAAAFGALSLRTLRWRQDVIGNLGLESLRWPEVQPTGSILGTWRGAPCFASVGDQQCALAGALLSEGELSVNVGTGAQVSMITDSLLTDTPNAGQIRPYFNGRFLRTITHLPGGRALHALLRLLTELGGIAEQDAWQEVERAIAPLAATDLRASLAFHAGPCGSAGFLHNLHEGNLTVGHVFRAAFESMAHNYDTCARQLGGTRAPACVVFSGGVLRRFKLLRELTAAALGLPHRLSPHPEDTLFGLMVLARTCIGLPPLDPPAPTSLP